MSCISGLLKIYKPLLYFLNSNFEFEIIFVNFVIKFIIMKKIFTLLLFVFFSLNKINAATFSSFTSGSWSTPGTWMLTGADTDGIPDLDDDVIINTGHSVSLTGTGTCKSITTNSSGTLVGNGQLINIYGNFTNNGIISGTLPIRFFASGMFSSSTLYTNPGNWQFYGAGTTYTIAAGTSINKINNFDLNNSVVITNLGYVQITGSINFWNTSQWINGTNSTLQIGRSFGGNTSGGLIASATGNTIIYNSGTAAMDVYPTTYYNLTFNGAAFLKTVRSNLVILNNFLLATSQFNLNNFNLTVGGNWNNAANYTIINQGIITFNGSGTQTISRTTANEQINNMIVSGTGTVLLNRTLFISQSLSINSGSTLDVNTSNMPIFLQGSLVNNGTLNCRQGTVTFNGTNAQTISGSSNTQFFNLTLSNPAGLSVNSPQSLTNILTNLGGNFNSNGNFTLISNSSSTARIAPIGGTASFSGNMSIQKYISDRVIGYHDFSSPVNSTTIMDWDNELYMSGIGNDDGTPGPAGVDGGASGTGSVYTYDESLSNDGNLCWVQVNGSASEIKAGKGYEIYLGVSQTFFTATTIDTKGVPNFGNKTYTLSYTPTSGTVTGTNLIGNPFASAINYSACTKTNVTGNVLILDTSGNYNDYGSNPIIPPHQGFWIFASGPGASITFPESSKATTTSTSFYRTLPNYGIKLLLSSPTMSFYHENTINFSENSSIGFDQDIDALYMKSPNKTAPAIYMLTNTDVKLITNNINTNDENVTIPLALFTPQEGLYYLEPNVFSTNNYNYVWIENTKTGKKYELNSSIAIVGKENDTNTDYVLRLSKKSSESDVNQAIFDTDLLVFGSENTLNLKAIYSTHFLSKVAIYDISGKLILEENNIILEAGNTKKIHVTDLSSGMYIVSVTDSIGHTKTQKIIR
jgi:hypothetical protein